MAEEEERKVDKEMKGKRFNKGREKERRGSGRNVRHLDDRQER